MTALEEFVITDCPIYVYNATPPGSGLFAFERITGMKALQALDFASFNESLCSNRLWCLATTNPNSIKAASIFNLSDTLYYISPHFLNFSKE
jgi:hypothetical protein